MVVSTEALIKAKKIAGSARVDRAEEYYKSGRVELKNIKYNDESNFEVKSQVKGHSGSYKVQAKVETDNLTDYSCTCMDQDSGTICKHIIATLIELDENEKYRQILRLSDRVKIELEERKRAIREYEEEKLKRQRYGKARELLQEFLNDIEHEETIKDLDIKRKSEIFVEEGKVRIVPKIINDYDGLKLEFQIGSSQMYKLKDIPEFLDNFENELYHEYGMKLGFKHTIDMFDNDSKDLVYYILKYARSLKYAKDVVDTSRYYIPNVKTDSLNLKSETIDEFFKIMKGKKVNYHSNEYSDMLSVSLEKPNIQFTLEKLSNDEYKLRCNIFSIDIISSHKKTYIRIGNSIYMQDKNVYMEKLLRKIANKYSGEYIFSSETINQFFSVIYPKIKDNFNTLELEEIKKYIPLKLGTKIYLDLNENNDITAKLEYCYGQHSFNPLNDDITDITRDIAAESDNMRLFTKTGFLVNNETKSLILFDEDKTYEFLTEGIEEFMSRFEILISDRFKTKQVKQPKIGTIGIRIESNLLNIDFSKMDIDLKELKNIIDAYSIKRKYYKLKDGSYLNLEDNKDLETIRDITDGLDVSYKDIAKGYVRVPMHRSMYLEKILDKNNNLSIEKDSNYRNLINDIENSCDIEAKLPKSLENTLRNYQKTGHKWLKTLDEYKFGGILADDMGLGKTLQVISIILSYIELNNNHKTSLVVCPSSLSLNWKNEVSKFAKDVKVQIVSGRSDEREKIIKDLDKCDILVTSYDLLKRDIDMYIKKGYNFKYVIADEAQYIKNCNTQNAKALKMINAETRFALTGTPMENSLSELWSIFDYILPGYLYSYSKFKKIYESPIIKEGDDLAMTKLKSLVSPFILRRIKKDVLTELPDKTVTVLSNEMDDKQKKVYLAYLSQVKDELKQELKNNSFEKSQIKILALLNRLRQICCHPSLFLDNYDGTSSKLEQCMEIIKEASDSKHKILLFSSYTSMFDILEKELEKENIKYYKLTGKTKVSDRIELVDKFNKDENVKVFLISLKAGGTGLNLTGADMVIHFDPWWNLSAENQATDRAYRIGQKNNVQVYKLITKDSIEEKINELQETKAKLIDDMLTTEETFINKLSKEDILSLFE